ncbi:hypothetical protein Tco_0445760, partial [Tanacetum coccineum]
LRNGKVYKWETATYGKIWYDEDVHYLRFFETEFPAIVYNDALASKSDFSSEPTVSILLFIKQRVKVNQKVRILELKQRNHKDYYSDNPYVISIKEDTAHLYPKLHSASTKERSIRRGSLIKFFFEYVVFIDKDGGMRRRNYSLTLIEGYVKLSCIDRKILAIKVSVKVETGRQEILRDLDQQMEKRADDGKANVVTVALSRKERVKPRRVRAMAMTIQYGVRGMILTAQSEAFPSKRTLSFGGSEILVTEAMASRLRWMIYLMVLADAAESVRDTIGFEYYLASSQMDGQSDLMIPDFRRYNEGMSPVLWAEIGESSLTGPELVLDTTDKVVLIILYQAYGNQYAIAGRKAHLLEDKQFQV